MPRFIVASKRTGTIRPGQGTPPIQLAQMTSEPTGAVEKETYRSPAAVSLPPKRRSRADSATNFEDQEADESIVPPISPVRRGHRLKRSGRLVLRWVNPKLGAPATEVASYKP